MKIKTLAAGAIVSAGLVAGVPMAGAQQEADGLVVVQIDDTNVNVTVPINAAVAIAANVCNVVVDANALASVDEGGQDFVGGDCDARSPAFAGQALTITNN